MVHRERALGPSGSAHCLRVEMAPSRFAHDKDPRSAARFASLRGRARDPVSLCEKHRAALLGPVNRRSSSHGTISRSSIVASGQRRATFFSQKGATPESRARSTLSFRFKFGCMSAILRPGHRLLPEFLTACLNSHAGYAQSQVWTWGASNRIWSSVASLRSRYPCLLLRSNGGSWENSVAFTELTRP